MAFRPDLMQRNVIPGSGAVMSAYDKIMAEKGFDREKYALDVARKNYEEWQKNNPGKGPADFERFIVKSAAWSLHQGPGGKAEAEKLSKAFGGGGKVLAPKREEDINLYSTDSRRTKLS
jgi:hypothetical protein